MLDLTDDEIQVVYEVLMMVKESPDFSQIPREDVGLFHSAINKIDEA